MVSVISGHLAKRKTTHSIDGSNKVRGQHGTRNPCYVSYSMLLLSSEKCAPLKKKVSVQFYRVSIICVSLHGGGLCSIIPKLSESA